MSISSFHRLQQQKKKTNDNNLAIWFTRSLANNDEATYRRQLADRQSGFRCDFHMLFSSVMFVIPSLSVTISCEKFLFYRLSVCWCSFFSPSSVPGSPSSFGKDFSIYPEVLVLALNLIGNLGSPSLLIVVLWAIVSITHYSDHVCHFDLLHPLLGQCEAKSSCCNVSLSLVCFFLDW